ncbi:MAG: TonB-dependent receptor [Mangrovibacterium sp.]|nr:TonB-dependent receptor [Mangrovibacterium sp.]
MRAGCSFVLILLTSGALGQASRTITGYVGDADTGEKLYAATVLDKNSGRGTMTNRYGFFSLTLPSGQVALECSFVGYQKYFASFSAIQDTLLNISLQTSNLIEEVMVSGARQTDEHGHEKISMSALKNMPSFLGEKDVMKTLMLLPGVQQGSEGNAGIYVRGGSPDQNLILLDDVPLYNASHLLGFVSVFTPEALQSVDFYKGAFPARFGGRLSSIVDVRMKDGNKYDYQTDLTLGMLTSKIVHEGPIKKGKSSYLISARRSLLDLLLTGIARPAQKKRDEGTVPGYGVYDLHAKVNLELNPVSHLNFSFYTGGDRLSFEYWNHPEYRKQKEEDNKFSIKWGNTLAVGRWNARVNPKLFVNTTLNWSRFRYQANNDFYTRTNRHSDEEFEENSYLMDYESHVETFGLKTDWDYYKSEKMPVHFGSFIYHHHHLPGRRNSITNGKEYIYSAKRVRSWEFGVYGQAEIPLNDKLSLSAGFRSLLFLTGEKTYPSFEPRLSIQYHASDKTTWTAAYTRMSQPIHLLTNSNTGMPSDIWVPATSRLRPQTAGQFSVGFSHPLPAGIRWNTEIYYKAMSHLVTYSQGYGMTDVHENWEDYMETGKGRAWGLETELKYNFSDFEAQLGYTLSRNERRFEDLNRGRWFPHKYDRLHKLDLNFIWKITPKWNMASSWTYQSGTPVSFSGYDYAGYPGNIPYGWHDIFTDVELDHTDRIQYYPSVNQTRMPSYHRMDIAFTHNKYVKKSLRQWSFGIYNLYFRQNPYFIYADTQPDGTTVYKQISLLPILPFVSYRITF